MLTQGLSSRRELVEQLEPEPLFDYLIQNGVLDQTAVEEIRQERSPAKVNLALLNKVQEGGKPAEALLIIVLRQSGQHYLANLLDDSDRIKALSGSGYLSKSRHKGQLTLKITIRAIRLPPDSYRSSSGELFHSREWLSANDFENRNGLSIGHNSTENSIPQFEINEPDEVQPKTNCFCGCFAKLFSKGKKIDKSQTNGNPGSTAAKYVETSPVVPPVPSPVRRANSERLLNIENLFRQKISEFTALFEDINTDSHILLLKYFEQEKGMLVLDTAADSESISVTNICTKAQQLRDLKQDYSSGKLVTDLERCLVTENLLGQIGATGLKLSAEYDQEELELTEHDLS